METSHRFKGEILQRVYKVWLVRRLLPVLALEVGLLAVLLFALGRRVFVQSVFENALRVVFVNPPQIFTFVSSAFLKSSPFSQVLGISVAVLMALFFRHLTQGALRFLLVRQNFFSREHGTSAG